MKKNIFIYSTFVLVLIAMAFSFSACSKDDKESTHLEAFGPSPALRGGELRFLGRGLNNVSEIILPGDISITNIERISDGEIKITLPQNATPGYVTLKASDGDIKTKTLLTFSEPISISKFYKDGAENVTAVKAGDRLVFKGDYLNLIREIVFTDNITVSLDRNDDETYSRDSLSIIVPLGAQSGKVALSNGASIPILVYTDGDLTVTLPSVKSISPATIKPGEVLTIKGENLQLIQKVKFNPETEVEITSAENPFAAISELKVKVPDNAQDGKVSLIAYSNLEIEAGTITLAMPTITSFSPATVKGGNTLTIKGTNLDLVTSIKFPNVAEGVEPKSKTATELQVEVPLAAGDGKLILHTAAEKTVEKVFTTVKSTITSIAPTSLTAGQSITIKGTDLDLALSAVFGGNVSVTITNPTPTSLTLMVPVTATSGTVTLKLVNGASVTSTESLEITAANRPIITTITSSVKPGDLLTITGSKLNLVESIIFPNGIKATEYGVRNQTTIEVFVPENAKKGSVAVTLKAYDGAEVTSPTFNIAGGVEPIEDPSLVWADFRDPWSMWGGIGKIVTDGGRTYYQGTTTGALAGVWMFANNSFDIPACPNISDYVVKADMKITKDFTPNAYGIQMCINGQWGWSEANFFPMASDGKTATTGGDWVTVTWTFSTLGISSAPVGGKSDTGLFVNSSSFDWANVALANIRYQKK